MGGVPVLSDAASAPSASDPDATSFQALSTPSGSDELFPGGDQLLALLRQSDWGLSLVKALDHHPVASGLVLGVLLGAVAMVAWRWKVQSQAWRDELAALEAEGLDLGLHPSKATVRKAKSWRLSRFEELPGAWPATKIMEREDVYDLEDLEPVYERKGFFRGRRRKAVHGWAVTVVPRE